MSVTAGRASKTNVCWRVGFVAAAEATRGHTAAVVWARMGVCQQRKVHSVWSRETNGCDRRRAHKVHGLRGLKSPSPSPRYYRQYTMGVQGGAHGRSTPHPCFPTPIGRTWRLHVFDPAPERWLVAALGNLGITVDSVTGVPSSDAGRQTGCCLRHLHTIHCAISPTFYRLEGVRLADRHRRAPHLTRPRAHNESYGQDMGC